MQSTEVKDADIELTAADTRTAEVSPKGVLTPGDQRVVASYLVEVLDWEATKSPDDQDALSDQRVADIVLWKFIQSFLTDHLQPDFSEIAEVCSAVRLEVASILAAQDADVIDD